MIDRLEQMEQRYNDLQAQFSLPEVINDHEKYQKTAKTLREIETPVEKYRELKQVQRGLAEARAMLTESDPDLRAMAEEEIASLAPRESALEEELKVLLLPRDPNDEKNVILEIRAGTGGDEASLFAAEIFRMYTRFAEQHKWKIELLSLSESGVGGYKEVIAIIEGNEASQFGIGIVSARIAEAVLRDERAVLPVGAFNAEYGVTLSLPGIVGRHGVSRILGPAMSDQERQALRASADVLRKAGERISRGASPSQGASRS